MANKKVDEIKLTITNYIAPEANIKYIGTNDESGKVYGIFEFEGKSFPVSGNFLSIETTTDKKGIDTDTVVIGIADEHDFNVRSGKDDTEGTDFTGVQLNEFLTEKCKLEIKEKETPISAAKRLLRKR